MTNVQSSTARSPLVRIVAVTCLSMSFAAWAQAAPAESMIPSFKDLDSMEARLQGCVTCHGRDGEGSADGRFPRIAGKPAGYLLHQLAAFRDGTRKYPPMNYLLAYMPDSYLREIAADFAAQRPPFAAVPAKTVDDASLQRGQLLATGGDAHLGIPACIACHGAALTGTQPAIPGLVGLRANYIVGQLTRWRVGDRHAIEPDCMKRIASRLTDADMTSVAAWLSQQEAPKNPSPQPQPAARLPLACGSQVQGDR